MNLNCQKRLKGRQRFFWSDSASFKTSQVSLEVFSSQLGIGEFICAKTFSRTLGYLFLIIEI